MGLALVLPCVQSIISDVYEPEQRGRAFGLLLTIASVGVLTALSACCRVPNCSAQVLRMTRLPLQKFMQPETELVASLGLMRATRSYGTKVDWCT